MVEIIEDVFLNLHQVLEYIDPESYLDIGANNGRHLNVVRQQLPKLKNIELVEACRHHKWDLEQTGYPFYIEVLSDSEKSVNFYLDTRPDRPTGPGNSYYPENSEFFYEFPSEERTTKTLDSLFSNRSFDLIKIDTQGSELDVIRGGINLISRAKALVVEESLLEFNIGSPLRDQVKSYIESIGFVFVRYLQWKGTHVNANDGSSYWIEKVNSFYVREDVFRSLPPLPISVGILAWHPEYSLRNSLESYKRNGLFDVVDDVVILFQDVRDEDRKLAKEYGLPFIGLDRNVGIGRGFVTLCEQADHPHVLLLEHDWELTENFVDTRFRLSEGLKMLQADTDVVRFRSRRNPGFPLFVVDGYLNNELNYYDHKIDLVSPHLFETMHWVPFPDQQYPGLIFSEMGHYVTTSRWSSWTNNPCLHRRDFYIELVSWFAEKGMLLEPEISHWWSRQQFKIAWGEGLFTHNDLDKYRNISIDNNNT
jgi:FkbM family methyltransferase